VEAVLRRHAHFAYACKREGAPHPGTAGQQRAAGPPQCTAPWPAVPTEPRGLTALASAQILTAAHCVETAALADVRAVIGANNLTNPFESNPGAVVEVREIFNLEAEFLPGNILESDPFLIKNDMALHYLRVNVTTIEPVKLNTNPSLLSGGENVTFVGWGNKGGKKEFTKVLHSVTAPVVPYDLCSSWYSKELVTEASDICVGYEEGGKDTCDGDSGGPGFIFEPDGAPVQVGVISWGYGCALPKSPTVMMNVAYFHSWLVDETTRTGVSTPTALPTLFPTASPSRFPSQSPSWSPTRSPTPPTSTPTEVPTPSPSKQPTASPTVPVPTQAPTLPSLPPSTQPTASPTPPTSAPSSDRPDSILGNSNSDKSLGSGGIAGTVIGVFLVLAMIAAAVAIVRRRRQRRAMARSSRGEIPAEKPTPVRRSNPFADVSRV